MTAEAEVVSTTSIEVKCGLQMTATGIAIRTEIAMIAATTEEAMAATAATAGIDMETEGTEAMTDATIGTKDAMVTTDVMIGMTGTGGIEGPQVRVITILHYIYVPGFACTLMTNTAQSLSPAQKRKGAVALIS